MHHRRETQRSLQSWWGWGVFLLALLGTAFWYGAGGWGGWNAKGPLWRGNESAQWPAEPSDSRGTSTGTPRASEAAIPALTGDAEGYFGRAVTATGRVTAVLGPRVFGLTAPGSSTELLIVAKDDLPAVGGRPPGASIQMNDAVEVYGLVERFDAGRFQREYRLRLDEAAVSARRGQPALIAERVRIAPGGALPTR